MKDINLNKSPNLPESDASLGDDTGTSKDDQKRGYSRIEESNPYGDMMPAEMSFEEPRGFLNRPQGWER